MIWAFVLFDTLSSAEGVINSIWIAVLMVITPWLLWIVSVIIRSILMRKRKNVVEETPTASNGLVSEIKNPVLFGTDLSCGSVIIVMRESKRESMYASSVDSDALF